MSFDTTHYSDHWEAHSWMGGFVSHWPQEQTSWLRDQCCGSGSGAFLTPRSGMEKIQSQDPWSGIRDEHPGSYFWEVIYPVFGLKYLTGADRNRDLTWKNQIRDPGSRIRNKHHGSATRDSPIYCNHSWTVFSNFLDQQSVSILHKLITVTQIF